MEIYFPHMERNKVQIALIQRQSEKLWMSPDDFAPVWVENFSEDFALLPEWLTIEEIEEELYRTPETQNIYAETVTALIMLGAK